MSGVAVTAGDEIAVGDIPNLTFDPVADESGTGYDSFTFQVRDDAQQFVAVMHPEGLERIGV